MPRELRRHSYTRCKHSRRLVRARVQPTQARHVPWHVPAASPSRVTAACLPACLPHRAASAPSALSLRRASEPDMRQPHRVSHSCNGALLGFRVCGAGQLATWGALPAVPSVRTFLADIGGSADRSGEPAGGYCHVNSRGRASSKPWAAATCCQPGTSSCRRRWRPRPRPGPFCDAGWRVEC